MHQLPNRFKPWFPSGEFYDQIKTRLLAFLQAHRHWDDRNTLEFKGMYICLKQPNWEERSMILDTQFIEFVHKAFADSDLDPIEFNFKIILTASDENGHQDEIYYYHLISNNY